MRTFKPRRLGFSLRAYEEDRRYFIAPAAYVFFAFEDRAPIDEVALWSFVGDHLGGDPLDEGMPKPRGEIILTARAFAPRGRAQPVVVTRAKCGAMDKSLVVAGDRYWETIDAGPTPFSEMPLTWERAFGGEGYSPNPAGKGLAPTDVDGKRSHPLPNVEDPRALVRSQRDRPLPAGYGAIDPTRPPRSERTGTYDKHWLETRYPGFPADFDDSFFNTAPDDQRVDGYFRGDEEFVFENLHATKPVLQGRLPGLRTRCFVDQVLSEGARFVEVPMDLETVHLFPHAERGVLIFRGILQVTDDDAPDIRHLILGCEAIGHARQEDHYRTALAKRLDPKLGALNALDDSDLLAPWMVQTAERDEDAKSKSEGLLRRNIRSRIERELESVADRFRDQGIDPQSVLPPSSAEDASTPSAAEISKLIERAASEREEAEARVASAAEEVRARCAAAGIDYDERRDATGGPPSFSAEGELSRLRSLLELARNSGTQLPQLESTLSDPTLPARLTAAERGLRDAYRRFAHLHAPAPERDPDSHAEIRQRVAAAIRERQSLANIDLTSVDLSGMDLRNADLRGAMMERCDLTAANAEGADLRNAVLTRSDLTRTMLTRAKLSDANIGEAVLSETSFESADLQRAILAKSRARRARFVAADLTGVDLSEADLGDVDATGITAPDVLLYKCRLERVAFARGDLKKTTFLQTSLVAVDFSDAVLMSATFVGGDARQCRFDRAAMDGARFVHAVDLTGSSFVGARLAQANFRQARIAHGAFDDATLDGADFSEAILKEATFSGARARGTRFVRSDLERARLDGADLMDAILQKARLHGADLSVANLFRADLARVQLDTATSFRDANLKRARMLPGATRGP